jgi:hypothetical protein
MRIPQLTLEPAVAPVRLPRLSGYSPMFSSVTAEGEAIRLFVPSNLTRPVLPLWGFATPSGSEVEGHPVITKREYSTNLVVSNASGSYELPLNDLVATAPAVELLPNGEILIVARRCRYYSDGSYDRNARIYNDSGEVIREFLLGDGTRTYRSIASARSG